MAWRTPKTDWNGMWVEDTYTGDFFSYTDMNRITGNIMVLNNLFAEMYPSVETVCKYTSSYTYTGMVYASDFNNIVTDLKTITQTLNLTTEYNRIRGYSYSVNGYFPDFVQLNNIEKAMLAVHDVIYTAFNSRRNLTFNLGDTIGI